MPASPRTDPHRTPPKTNLNPPSQGEPALDHDHPLTGTRFEVTNADDAVSFNKNGLIVEHPAALHIDELARADDPLFGCMNRRDQEQRKADPRRTEMHHA